AEFWLKYSLLLSIILSLTSIILFGGIRPSQAQEIYFTDLIGRSLYSYDLSTCQFGPEVKLEKNNLSTGGISFHPDGRIYIISGEQLISINILKNQTEAVFPITSLKHYSSLAISEDGKMLIGQESDYTEDEFVTMDFDVRHPELIDTVVFGGIDNLRLRGRIRGMINDHQYLVQNMMGSGEGEVMNMYRIWDAETNSIDTFRINHPEEYYISLP